MTEKPYCTGILGRSVQTVDAAGNKHWHEIGERRFWSDGTSTFTSFGGAERQFEMPGDELLQELGHHEPHHELERPRGRETLLTHMVNIATVVIALLGVAIVVARCTGGPS